jgi:uncharacterized membrane protein
MTTVMVQKVSGTARIGGVDVARGLALFGMMAVHSWETFTADGRASLSTMIAGGRSAATFVFVAGVSLAFLSGGRSSVRGRTRVAAASGIAVRALLVGVAGLGLAALGPRSTSSWSSTRCCSCWRSRYWDCPGGFWR